MTANPSAKSSDFDEFYKKDGDELNYMEAVQAREQMTPQQVANTFNTWVENGAYDKDVSNLNYSGPVVTARVAAELFSKDRESVKVIDIAAGSGLAARELRKLGFGKIDAIDPSRASKKAAMDAGLYDNYLVDFVNDKKLDIETDAYDLTFSSGGFAPGLMPCVALKEFIRLTKPGGYVCLSVPIYIFEYGAEYKDKLEPLMDLYIKNGIWEKISRTVVDGYLDQKQGVIFVFKVLKSQVD